MCNAESFAAEYLALLFQLLLGASCTGCSIVVNDMAWLLVQDPGKSLAFYS